MERHPWWVLGYDRTLADYYRDKQGMVQAMSREAMS
jgi:hypothetical protein